MESSIDIRLDRLTAEVSQLRHEIQLFVNQTTKTGPRYISTKDFGLEIGKTSRTVCQWVTDGRFPDTVYKRKRRGKGFVYLLDRVPALRVAEQLIIT